MLLFWLKIFKSQHRLCSLRVSCLHLMKINTVYSFVLLFIQSMTHDYSWDTMAESAKPGPWYVLFDVVLVLTIVCVKTWSPAFGILSLEGFCGCIQTHVMARLSHYWYFISIDNCLLYSKLPLISMTLVKSGFCPVYYQWQDFFQMFFWVVYAFEYGFTT